MATQNRPLWPEDYFELKETEKKQIQEKLSVHPYLPKSETTLAKVPCPSSLLIRTEVNPWGQL